MTSIETTQFETNININLQLSNCSDVCKIPWSSQRQVPTGTRTSNRKQAILHQTDLQTGPRPQTRKKIKTQLVAVAAATYYALTVPVEGGKLVFHILKKKAKGPACGDCPQGACLH